MPFTCRKSTPASFAISEKMPRAEAALAAVGSHFAGLAAFGAWSLQAASATSPTTASSLSGSTKRDGSRADANPAASEAFDLGPVHATFADALRCRMAEALMIDHRRDRHDPPLPVDPVRDDGERVIGHVTELDHRDRARLVGVCIIHGDVVRQERRNVLVARQQRKKRIAGRIVMDEDE